MTALRAPVVVVGIGNPMRHDDGVGPATIMALRATKTPSETELVQLDGEAARLIECWRDRRLAIVVDAVLAGSPPGTIHRVEPKAGQFPPSATTSSHAAGLAAALALASALQREPARLVVFGIEPEDLDPGLGLSNTVAKSVPEVAALIRSEIQRTADSRVGGSDG